MSAKKQQSEGGKILRILRYILIAFILLTFLMLFSNLLHHI